MSNRQKLTLASYVRPGTIIGQAYNPQSVNLGSFPRVPTFIGKGVPYLIAENLQLVRGFLHHQKLEFTSNAPFQANLPFEANGSQLPSGNFEVKLYNSNGVAIDPRYWKFTKSSPTVAGYDLVQVFSRNYTPSDTYYIDYQSTDSTVVDQLPISGLRSVNLTGDNRFEDFYKNDLDVNMVTTVEQPVPVTQVGAGSIRVNADSDYQSWTKNFSLAIENSVIIPTPTLASNITYNAGGGGEGRFPSVVLNSATSYEGVAPAAYFLTVSGVAEVTATTNPTALTSLTVGDTFLVPSAALGAWAGYSGLRATLLNAPGGTSGAYTYQAGDWLFDYTTFDLTVVKYASDAANPQVAGSVAVTTIAVPLFGSTKKLSAGDGIYVDISTLSDFANGDWFKISAAMFDIHNVQMSWFNDDYQSESGLVTVKTGDVMPVSLHNGILLDFGQASKLDYNLEVGAASVSSADIYWTKMIVPAVNVVSSVPGTWTGDGLIISPKAVATGPFVGKEGYFATYLGGLQSDVANWHFEPGFGGRVTATTTVNENLELIDGLRIDVTLANLVEGDCYVVSAISTTTRPQINLARTLGIQSGIQMSSGIDYTGTIPGDDFLGGVLTDFRIGDSWTLRAINHDALSWNFTRVTTDTFTPSNIYYDAVGLVTGVPRSYYLTLNHVPTGLTTLGTMSKVSGSGNVNDITLNSASAFTGKAPDTYRFSQARPALPSPGSVTMVRPAASMLDPPTYCTRH
jgi:hypothetical protein